ncbi:MAG: energy transducer TonB [Gomphosphaeria aponina SAG 52.96 = DSM 107014]|uniref:Energy transducer TonB n=1 Tax=Gomphosphaeria aponina SAG 52.96 = DSM 107014 TaxID=1521640 RepID=A0A941GXG2_9CHRO|nr:energy transducer TonB [Gomphosphaeria aponina SAG 52.96 = DSM 107014]
MSSNVTIVLNKLRQPNNMAIAVSVVLHFLVLGIALPIFKLSHGEEIKGDCPRGKACGHRFVQLMDLNVVDLTRLPFSSNPSQNLNSSINSLSSPRENPSVQIPLLLPSAVNPPQNFNPALVNPFPTTSNNHQSGSALFPNLPLLPLPPLTITPSSGSANNPQINSNLLSPPPPPPVVVNEKESVFPLTPAQVEFSQNPIILSKKPKSDNSSLEILATEENLQVAVHAQANLVKFDPINTTEEEGMKNYADWLASVPKKTPIEFNFTGIYPQDACLRQIEGTTVYGVLVDTNGKVTDAKLLQSSGYLLLNQQALQEINASTWLNTAPQSPSYRVSVNFEYKSQICPSLTVP